MDQKDGVRILKCDVDSTTILAQAILGTAGDVGLALALDPAGNVYVTGTTTSTVLAGTAGAAIPARTDGSANGFVAKFDGSLNPLFVTFTGGSRIVPNAIAASSTAVYVTGFLYGSNLPVTASAILQNPAYGSSQNGFAESFSASGARLNYATYLTGANGDTGPASIAVDTAGDVYVAGSTSASGYPTVNAVVPAMLGNPSGFVTRLTPDGDGITFSTYIPGSGIGSIAIDPRNQMLLLAGSVSLGHWPVDTVQTPLVPIAYQVLIRMSLDGSTVQSSTVLAPGTQTYLAPAGEGAVWIDGALSIPLLPLAPLETFGQGFAVHVNPANVIDQTARFGAIPNGNATYASIPLNLTSVAVDPAGEPIVAGGIQPTASSSLLATETYDLPLMGSTTSVLPSSLASAIPATASCSGSLCPSYAAYLAKLSAVATTASLSFSIDAAPLVTLRNLGSGQATSLLVAATGGLTIAGDCGTTLISGAECNLLLNGSGAGTLTASASNATTQTVAIPAFASPSSTIVFSPRELDFGIQTSTSPETARVVTVTNLGQQSQTFTSALDSAAKTSLFSQTATDCILAGASGTYTLASGDSCHITLGLTPSSTATSDGIVQAQWLIGTRDLLLTGYSEAASLSLSASEIDFGTQYTGGLRLQRYLYLSNNSSSAIAHTAVTLAAGSPFSVTDACPATLEPATICRIQLGYLSAQTPSTDSVTLSLDQGMSALITGRTLPAPTATAASVNPNLAVSTTAVSFANAVPVTGVSSETQTVTLGNPGASAFALALSLTGDFIDATSCGTTLPAGATCTVVLSFAPSQPGVRNGLLAVTAGAGTSPAYVTLSGTGTAILPANNGTLAFSSVPVGQAAVLWFKVSQPFSSLSAAATGPYTALLVEDIGYGHGQPASSAFTANASGTCLNCWLGIQFLPTAATAQSGTLLLASTSLGNAYVLALSGTGQATTGLILTPATQDFGSIPVHSSSGANIFALTNATGADVILTAPVITGEFALASAVTGAQICSAGVLSSTATCFLPISFSPAATGSRTGSVSFTTSDGRVASASLTGFGENDPGISLNPASLTFSNVPGGTATVQSITVGNTGTSNVQIGTPATATASFAANTNCGSLVPGATCAIAIAFIPGNSTVSDTLQITVNSTTYSVPLTASYTAADAGLQVLPAQMEYGPQATGIQGQTRRFTISNLTAKSLALDVILPRQFVSVGAPCAGLAPNASCTFSVAFLPLTNGDILGTLFAQATPSDGSATLNGIGYLEGYGTGTGTLVITGPIQPGNVLNFGQVPSGQNANQMLNLTNGGTVPVTIRRVTSQAPFFATSNCGATLATSQSCTVTIAYTPTNQVATGTLNPAATFDSGTLIVESDAGSSPNIYSLTGSASPLAVTSPSNTTPLATLAISQSSLSFAATPVGGLSVAQSVTIANTGTRTIHIGSLQTTADFALQSNCSTVVPGASCTVSIVFSPQTTGTHASALEITSDAVTGLEFISLIGDGSPASLSISPAALSFGVIPVGTAATLPAQVTNNSSSAIVLGTISTSGDYAVTGTCPTVGSAFAAGASCALQIAFTPTLAGARSGTLSVASSASTQPITAALTGIGGQANLQLAPTSLTFSSTAIGSSSSAQAVTLTNSGNVALTALSIAIAGDFTIAAPCGVTSLAAGAVCTMQIVFSPTAAGTRLGSLTIVSSGTSAPTAVPLSGMGVAVGGFALTVDGSSAASVPVVEGAPAVYQLNVSPTNGFTGGVALTCAPVGAVAYASCSLLPSIVTLGTGAQAAAATINTITSVASAAANRPGDATLLLCFLIPATWLTRRHRSLRLTLASLVAILGITSCGGGGGTAPNPNLRYTPAGSYQFQVTASSVNGVGTAQTVTLNLTVQ